MGIIVAATFLIVGAILAVFVTGRFSARDPYGVIPYFIGDLLWSDFPWYTARSLGYFFLMVATALAYPSIGLWSFLLMALGALPSLMMTREHNRRARSAWWRESFD
ncbi:hypothetical protein ACXZ66_03155 [Corynebacterium sp. S7]